MDNYLKRTQEQATAAWINQLIQKRLSELIEALTTQDISFEQAMDELQELKTNVADLIFSNRGGEKGVHGFIAEAAEVGFENAENLIKGLKASCTWINDNNPQADIQRDDVLIQLKFVQKNFGIGYKGSERTEASGFYYTLKYHPEFLKQGGKLMTSKDYYERIIRLYNMTQEEASKLTRNSPDGLTYTAWREVHNFFETTGATPADIEPSLLTNSEVQKGAIAKTIQKEEARLKEIDQQRRMNAVEKSKPTAKEGTTVTAVSAVLEGGTAFCTRVIQKRKDGKKISEFTAKDWKEIGIDTTLGTAKGGIRGAVVYALSNFTATPANVATGLVTATFGVMSQAKLLREGMIDDEEFLINSEALCLDVSISTVSALLGQTIIPIPVLGAIIGNTAGMFLYDIAKSQGLKQEQALIKNYQAEITSLNEVLEEQYKSLLRMLEESFKKFKSMMELAFNPDINKAFEASIEFARFNGVAEERILKSKTEIDAYFLS